MSQCRGGGSVDAQILAQHDAVILARRARRDELLLDVRPHRRGIALERIAPAAAAAGAHDPPARPRPRAVRPPRHADPALAGPAQKIHAVSAGPAAPQAPGRALAPPHQLEIPFALDQVAHPHVDAEAAAMLAGAAGIGAQRAAFDQHRALELDPFDRAVAHVALAHRDGAGFAVLERPPAPAAALDALHHEPPVGPG